MEQKSQKFPTPRDADSGLPELDLNALLVSSREAIARAAAEVLAEREAETLLATKHRSHSVTTAVPLGS